MVKTVEGMPQDAGNKGTWVTFENNCFTVVVPSYESPWFKAELADRIGSVLSLATQNNFKQIAFPVRFSTNPAALVETRNILVNVIGDAIGNVDTHNHLGMLKEIFIICETSEELEILRGIVSEKVPELKEMRAFSSTMGTPLEQMRMLVDSDFW